MSNYPYLFIGGELDGKRLSGRVLDNEKYYTHSPSQVYRKETFGELQNNPHDCFVLESMTRAEAFKRISA